jgi:hypothetical protein
MVRSLEFLNANQQVVLAVTDPTAALIDVPVAKGARAIRVRFTGKFSQAAQKPSSPNTGDPNYKSHNVLVLPQHPPVFGMDFVPGKLVIENATTIRWEVNPESRFFNSHFSSIQEGAYTFTLFAQDDPVAARRGITDTSNVALDGEPKPFDGTSESGDGNPKGDFPIMFRMT